MRSTGLANFSVMAFMLLAATAATTCGKGINQYPPITNSGGGGATGGGGSGGTTTSTTSSTGGAGPSCDDKVQNQNESDVDCGGPCSKCADGRKCEANTDCASGLCDTAGSVCAPDPCKDTTQNGNETDIDCGGTCPKCADAKKCLVDGDCTSGYCDTAVTPAVCAAPKCTDQVKNGNETDVDCGGACPPCADDKNCQAAADCDSSVCIGNKCIAPSCIDQVKNGSETDVDCGGSCGSTCGDGNFCSVDNDCGGGYCNHNQVPAVCKTPTCSDGFQDGTESDVDCGGTCIKCDDGKKCNVASDCASKICANGTCAVPTCTDAVKNGVESDADCGGNGACPRCQLTKACTQASDCASQTCGTGGLCVCPPGMVTAPKLGGGAYCIDQKEVTYKQYQIFYTANPPTANQSAWCLWNTNYSPTGDWPALPNREEEPVRYVNWCQAEAYCRYNGRHLCGSISGGASLQSDYADASKSAWYNACTAQGANPYPYGNAFQGAYCDSALQPLGAPGPDLTGKNLACQGGVPALYDMSGNVAEWEDSCSGSIGKNDTCLVRGGSWKSSTPESLRCDSGGTAVQHARDYADADIGFRCCL